MDKLLKQKELAEKLSVERNTINNWVREGMPYEGNEKFKRYNYETVLLWLKTRSKENK